MLPALGCKRVVNELALRPGQERWDIVEFLVERFVSRP